MSDVDEDKRLEQTMEFAKWAEEALDPELERWIEDSPMWGRSLKHPLVYQVPLSLPGMANRQYEQKKEMLASAVAKRDWHSFIWIHERPYRVDALLELLEEEYVTSGSILYWELVRDIWIDSENIWQNMDEWLPLLHEEGAELMMDDDEKALLAALPDVVPVYRGAHLELNEEGLSWSTSHERALWFGKRFKRDAEAVVVHATVRRENILALFESRGEDEVVILPEHITVDHYEEI